jgi:formiminotetrahydrofolate cyclodeaminase
MPTTRELAAMFALAGLLAQDFTAGWKEIAADAVDAADALLDALEKDNTTADIDMRALDDADLERVPCNGR